ncbi:MAG: UDP-N-acetylmuramyl-tripeptide synthetase [Minisyncoccia bacterium]
MYEFVNRIVRLLKKVVPEPVVRPLRPLYHRALTFLMAASYGFPARKLIVIGVTGTKGKSTVAEMVFQILRASGKKTGLISTIRFAIEDESEPNLYKMTLQGRGFAQSFMRKALDAGCTHFVIEVTSESVLQFRNRFLDFNGLIVTNIQKEHIESHGSFEKYVAAKRAIVDTLVHSPKRPRILVANGDISETRDFLSAKVERAIPFQQEDMRHVVADDESVRFTYGGTPFVLPLPGTFNATNALAAVKLCEAFGIPLGTAASALAKLPVVRGRVERIEEGQDFIAVVDYAHTPDSLRALYSAFPHQRKICLLGNTGGGRDTWKRAEMGRIADETCDKVILANEDPYDEDPRAIVDAMAKGMKRAPEIIMDRREAIRHALSLAKTGDAVLISGKGTDPYIMGPRGTKEPWSDARVVREELGKMLGKL